MSNFGNSMRLGTVRTASGTVWHPDTMTARIPLPRQLTNQPFSVRAAREAGVGERRLYGADLTRPFYGVRALPVAPTPGETSDQKEQRQLLTRCREYAPRMAAGHYFSHITAARLWGCPMPKRFGPTELLHVSNPSRATRCAGVVGHLSSRTTTFTRSGLPVSDPVSAWLEVAALLSVDDLVAVGDHLILDPRVLDPRDLRPYVTHEQLAVRLASFSGRGARKAALALALLRQGAESRPESLLRLLLGRAGYPEPVLQAEIVDAAGRWLGYADLYWPDVKVIVEYDGKHHENESVRGRDNTRIEDFVAAGNAVVRVSSVGLFTAPDTVLARVERAFNRIR